MTDLITLKKDIINAWRDLKNDNLTDEKRVKAYNEVVFLTGEIRKQDKNFSANEIILGKYKQFKGDTPDVERKVRWVKATVMTSLKKEYNYYVATALEIVSERHPDLDSDTDKFGTIVNATVANLIALAKK